MIVGNAELGNPKAKPGIDGKSNDGNVGIVGSFGKVIPRLGGKGIVGNDMLGKLGSAGSLGVLNDKLGSGGKVGYL